jgi:hypothetical protein
VSAKKTTTESAPAKKAAAKKKESTKKAAVAVAAKQADHKVTAETPVTSRSAKPKKSAQKPASPRSTATKKTTEKPTSSDLSAIKKSADKATASQPETTPRTAVKRQKTAAGPVTAVIAKLDVGYGNNLYIRGEGGELNWEKGILMENAGSDEWSWSTTSATGEITFKFLINDDIWSTGENFTVAAGDTSISSPAFFVVICYLP